MKSLAIVQEICNGRHGLFVKASTCSISCVTFSLTVPVWAEQENLEEGHLVVLEGFTNKRAGWRAGLARFFRPEDEKEFLEEKKRLLSRKSFQKNKLELKEKL